MDRKAFFFYSLSEIAKSEQQKDKIVKKDNLIVLIILACIAIGCTNNCKKDKETTFDFNTSTTNKSTNVGTKKMPTTTAEEDSTGTLAVSVEAPSGKTIAAPESGKASIWGQVMYNSQPVGKIEVKLCETLVSFNMQCSGKTFKTLTNSDGEYLLENIPAKSYGGLIVKVFTSNFYIFDATQYGGMPKKYDIKADQTFYVRPTNLFKNDLKPLTPKSNGKESGQDLELTWQAYPDASYYNLSLIYSGKDGITSPYVSEKVEGTTFKADKPIEAGQYWFQLEAYNAEDVKISQSERAYKVNVIGEAAAK
jgi:hypothetical protein